MRKIYLDGVINKQHSNIRKRNFKFFKKNLLWPNRL